MRPTRAATLTALGGALIPITSLFAPALSHAGAYTVAAGDEIAALPTRPAGAVDQPKQPL